MSVTFVVRGANNAHINHSFKCPECGASPGKYGRPSCSVCMGYGEDPNDDPFGDFSLDLCNRNAGILIRDILNYGEEEKDYYCGSLNPSEVLIRLAQCGYKLPALTIESSVSKTQIVLTPEGVDELPRANVYEFGLDEERLNEIVRGLTRLAEKAIEIGEEISYG